MTPLEKVQLELAKLRIEQRRELGRHEAARRRGDVPDVPLQVLKEGRAAVAAATDAARELVALALKGQAPAETRIAAAQAAVAALPLELQRYAERPSSGGKRRAAGAVTDTAKAVRAALERGIVGHRAQRGNAWAYVQQEDLEALVPDGWGRRFPRETQLLAARAGVPPLAVPLLCLLTWCSRRKEFDPNDPRRCGAGLQVSLEWLARKLGCSTSWVKQLLNKLDPFAEWRRECRQVAKLNRRRRREGKAPLSRPTKPRGTPYVHRFRRLEKYSELPKRDGVEAAAWVDKLGRVHHYVDVRGVCYVTDAGRALLVRRAHRELPKPGEPVKLRPNGCLTDLELRLHALRWRLSARLRRGDAMLEQRRKSNGAAAGPPRALKRVAT